MEIKGDIHLLKYLKVPAALLSWDGGILDSNFLFSEMSEIFISPHAEKIKLASRSTQEYFLNILEKNRDAIPTSATSICYSAQDRHFVLHLVPFSMLARGVGTEATMLLFVIEIKKMSLSITQDIIKSVFSLTSSEAKLASCLMRFLSLRKASEFMGIKHSTARAYMIQVFRKTDTQNQLELYSLLSKISYMDRQSDN
ncbi:helix-turn-helix transcriptional regulator [Phyllobacterium sp. TAF24]|uniref:helix-turn-helix transcriptional regulator n=1 Tax=Phyllobacterium sp. TAF24 TaxID=3233068 RepID=UPI003F9CB0F5